METTVNAWPLAGLLLDALSRRDFDALESCLDPEVRFRALLPRGPMELGTATETADRFRTWFGGDDGFEVIDASVSQIGTKIYARWRIRMTPRDASEPTRVAEQHVYTTGSEQIATLDLLCSGFHSEADAPTCAIA